MKEFVYLFFSKKPLLKKRLRIVMHCILHLSSCDRSAIHREAITPTCFRRYRDIAVWLILFIFFFLNRDTHDCNLELLVNPPSRGNYRKVPFPRAQQHDHGWIRTHTISIKDRARNIVSAARYMSYICQ